MIENIIEVKGLVKNYKHKKLKDKQITAVNNINFQVKKGEIFGFLGRNGAGKSTTIKIITGQLLPSEGEIRVCGFDIEKNHKELAMKIGVVPELPNLYEGLTARKNLEFFGELYSVKKERVTELIERFGLVEHENKGSGKLSKGLRQKVLIARALLHSPDILFLDEPTSGLDPNNAQEIRKIITEYKESGKTVFITTHNMNVAETLCDRVAIMKDGDILALDSPDNLKFNHSDKRVRVETTEGVHEYLFEDFIKLNNNDFKGLKTIHSLEPTLEDVFIKLAGGE